MLRTGLTVFTLLFLAQNALALTNPDWSKNAFIPEGTNRSNIYNLNASDLEKYTQNGFGHAAIYPVSVTGLLIPYRPFVNVIESKNPIKSLILKLMKKSEGYSSEKDFYEWLGLSPYNNPNAKGIYHTPILANSPNAKYLGAGLIQTPNGPGLTFSCYACHASNLFGVTVVGLPNKQPHANVLFHQARKMFPLIPGAAFRLATGANSNEMKIFERTKENIMAVYSVEPQVLGLDTSLPHTALSLARRNDDAYATKNKNLEKYPRHNELMNYVGDSKPMPWWTVKYKTRWLSDGSVISGNPIFTNLLWNELGRGTDLYELEDWMKKNEKVVQELTAHVFNTEPPRYVEFFSSTKIDLESAKRGEALFNNNCVNCHGAYQKAWSQENAEQKLSKDDLLKTTKVIYHEVTPVINVGTDPQRYISMNFFAQSLNDLAISKWMGTVVEPQEGYVPPPLNGIWARYPYFHNNSVPTLCEVIELPKNRTKVFYLGPAENRATDFDEECNGYPVGNNVPEKWRNADQKMDTSKAGLRNIGHESMLLDANGKERYSKQDKKDLVNFLKTL